jgi:nucleoside-diphosphate-sugar epimerase
LNAIVRDHDAIIHLAGLAHVSRNSPGDSWDRFHAVNVDATRRLAQAAAEEGVRRFVLMSSGAVNGVRTGDRPFVETDPANPSSHYGLSKQQAEECLQAVSHASGMDWVILRPPVLVGANTPGNIETVMKIINSGLPLPFGAIRNRRSYLGLRNFSDFVALATLHPAAANEVFLLTDQPSMSTADLVKTLSAFMERPARLFSVPVGIIKAGALVTGKTSALKPLWSTLELDATKAVELLGWTRDRPLEEAFRDAAVSFLKPDQDRWTA